MLVTDQILVATFAEGIARKEGYYDRAKNGIPNIAQRLNNPGDLRQWRHSRWVYDPVLRKKAQKWVPFPVLNGYVQFPPCKNGDICNHPDHPSEQGWAAIREQCATNIFKRQLTFLEFFQGKRERGKTLYMGYRPSADKDDPYVFTQFVLAFVKRKLALDESVNANTVIASVVTDRPVVSAPAPHYAGQHKSQRSHYGYNDHVDTEKKAA